MTTCSCNKLYEKQWPNRGQNLKLVPTMRDRVATESLTWSECHQVLVNEHTC